MPIQNSPSVVSSEKDLSLGVRGVGTSTSAIVIQSRWGAIEKPVLLADEDELIINFATPDLNTTKDYHLATNFLAYSPNMYVCRVAGVASLNAANSAQTPVLIKNDDEFEAVEASLTGYSSLARFAGSLGNSIKVVVIPQSKIASSKYADELQYEHDVDEYAVFVIDATGKWTGFAGTILETYENLTFTVGSKKDDGSLAYIKDVINQQSSYIYIADETQTIFDGVDQTQNIVVEEDSETVDGSVTPVETVTFTGLVDLAVTDALQVKVNSVIVTDFTVSGVDEITFGTPLTGATDLVELTRGVTEITATTLDTHHSITNVDVEGVSVGYSQAGLVLTLDNPIFEDSTVDISVIYEFTMVGGADDYSATDYIDGYELYEDEENYDFFALIGSVQDVATASACYDVVETRKDCVFYHSPPFAACVNNNKNELPDVVEYFSTTLPRSSTYAFRSCNWKYQFDSYNDKFVWIPDCADAAGLQAQVQDEFDPWYIGAGYDNGRMKNVVKLAWNPSKRIQKDTLFKAAINPVFTEKGEGVLLMGDKTATLKPTAFDSIGIRLMFIYMKKSIKESAKYNLFKFNDEFTRTAFVNTVDPFLEDIKGRRGIEEKLVKCDIFNNTPQVRQERKFIGDIFVKPNYAIRFIQLNFIAVGATISFEEIEGV